MAKVEMESRSELNLMVAEKVFGKVVRADGEDGTGRAVSSGHDWLGYNKVEVGVHFRWNGRIHGPFFAEEARETKWGPIVDYEALAVHLWTNREGQPYQEDIEAHVNCWRPKVPNYSGNPRDTEKVLREMQLYWVDWERDRTEYERRRRSAYWRIVQDPDEWIAEINRIDEAGQAHSWTGRAGSMGEAICWAAIRAVTSDVASPVTLTSLSQS